MEISIKFIGSVSDLPQRATEGSAGVDLRSAAEDVVLHPSERKLIPTGICIAVPRGYNAEIRPRSGLAFKNGITVLNTPGTIDSDYRGELKVLLINLGQEDFLVEKGMRIAQLVVQKCEKVEWKVVEALDDTSRSEGGYGSTGVR